MSAPPRLLGAAFAMMAACAAPAARVRTAPAQPPVDPPAVARADLDRPTRLVVRSEAEWAALWDRMYSGRGEKPPARPAIDFERHMVLFATLGPRPGGYAAKISDVAIDGGVLRASVVEKRPGARCTARDVRVAPTAIATVPRFEGPVTFAERVDAVPCK